MAGHRDPTAGEGVARATRTEVRPSLDTLYRTLRWAEAVNDRLAARLIWSAIRRVRGW